ncbi:hypothetical protein [uncultured Thiodictyon sp.]|jgi:5-methylcytosine-specific restriction endonuclease McrBC regulatory subunit McrC|uniref:McrC family protein n=1 Tax=uncultured Thiodictyon sp. TaxID=1846217 RepID=UPI0025CC61BA|nr:hypothetical protein [uncultured Thiodictyon sp.]
MSWWVSPETLCGQNAHGHYLKEWERVVPRVQAINGDVDLATFTHWGQDHIWNEAVDDEGGDAADNPRTLGLHWSRRSIHASHFIGAVRLGNEADAAPLIILPKVERMDLAGMFAAVLAAPQEHTGTHLDHLFGCDVEQDPIDGVDLPDLTLLEVIAYLHALSRFVQRSLRQGFMQIRTNLVGKVRGRVLIAEQIRQNLVHARADRMVCEFTVFNLDTLENRILKAALQATTNWLTRQALPGSLAALLHSWSAISRTGLAGVPEYRVNPRDWVSARKNGLMAAYATPLAYARLVLTRLHIAASGQAAEEGHRTLPFFLDANRLFEGWVGVCLAAANCHPISQKTSPRTICGKRVEFTPDFVLTDPHAVVDAKYKRLDPRRNQGRIPVTDLYQIIGYTRLLEIPGQQGYTQAWLAVPHIDPAIQHLDLGSAKTAFGNNWANRIGTTWPDGYILGCVLVPLPILQIPGGG